MSEEEKDILFDIDMQLYGEFNDKIASMYDHLGEAYTLRDIEELEKIEKETEIELLREAIRKLQKVIDLMAEQLTDVAVWDLPLDEIHYWNSKDEVIDYFYKKVEE